MGRQAQVIPVLSSTMAAGFIRTVFKGMVVKLGPKTQENLHHVDAPTLSHDTSVEIEIIYRECNRRTLMMTVLLTVSDYFPSAWRLTYTPPIAKTTKTPIFCRLGSCSWLRAGIGQIKTTMSETILREALANQRDFWSKHVCGPTAFTSQKKRKG